MNVNDLDLCRLAAAWRCWIHIAVEQAEPSLLEAIGPRAGDRRRPGRRRDSGRRGLPGCRRCCAVNPSPYGFDLVGSAFGVVGLDAIIDGSTRVRGT